MAAKRFLSDSGSDDADQPTEKRFRTGFSFSNVIGKVLMQNSLQSLCSSLEPLLRRVVSEEVEHSLRRRAQMLTRSPSFRVQALEPSSLRLVFTKKLSLTIFTGSKVVDTDNMALQVILVNTGTEELLPTSPPYPIKLEVVALDGDFPGNDHENWSGEEFNRSIVKERTGKRPLLTGDLTVTMREGTVTIGDIEFTDNSSWIRSRKFRIGVRVAPGSCQAVRIREAMTDAFVVKDHRGELYKKHYPPMLEDEVWRLEKIGKDGAFHKKLESEGIKTVQDFLKLFVVDHKRLREILGAGMSEKMWEVTIKHAKTCCMGNKRYIFRGNNYVITLNPVCQVVRVVIDGQNYPTREITGLNKAYVERLVKEAYTNWTSLDVVDECPTETPLLTQGEEVDHYSNPNRCVMRSFQGNSYMTDAAAGEAYLPGNVNSEGSDWQMSPAYLATSIQTGLQFSVSESSSEGELATSRSFIGGSFL